MPDPKEPKKVEEEEETACTEEDELSDKDLDAVAGAGPREERDD